MTLQIVGTGLIATVMALGGSPAFAQLPPETVAVAGATVQEAIPIAEARPSSAFLPADFVVPVSIETPSFKLVPLGPALVKMDFDAYMSSIAHLQETFTRSTDWPREDLTMADAMRDMEAEESRFENRQSFAYAVLATDGSREIGSVYVSPSTVTGYDAVVRMWVTKADYEAGRDTELFGWVTQWIQADWPFANVAYPGRAIDWSTWEALVAESSPRTAELEEQND
jgi:hypothetical protein